MVSILWHQVRNYGKIFSQGDYVHYVQANAPNRACILRKTIYPISVKKTYSRTTHRPIAYHMMKSKIGLTSFEVKVRIYWPRLVTLRDLPSLPRCKREYPQAS